MFSGPTHSGPPNKRLGWLCIRTYSIPPQNRPLLQENVRALRCNIPVTRPVFELVSVIIPSSKKYRM
jgi:hypothetical protein